MYIAISKWQGTFFAWIATALTVTTDPAHQWPESFWSFLTGAFTHTTYPLTPMINVMYGVTFLVDIVYIGLLYAKLKERGISPWRRL